MDSKANLLRIELVRSLIGTRVEHRACAYGLGLRHRHQVVIRPNTPAVRGMVNAINYLLRWESADAFE